jgi:hypothetical protein
MLVWARLSNGYKKIENHSGLLSFNWTAGLSNTDAVVLQSLLLNKWFYAVESLLCNNKYLCSVIMKNT